MENQFQKAIVITIVIICAVNQSVFCQLNMQSNGPDFWGSMDFTLTNPPEAIGIGNFLGTTPVTPASALHINTNTFTPTFFSAGEVFRTDAPSGLTAWRMFSSNVAANEKFNILNPNGSNNITLGTVQSGNLNFFTNNTQKMTLDVSGNLDINTATGFMELTATPFFGTTTSPTIFM